MRPAFLNFLDQLPQQEMVFPVEIFVAQSCDRNDQERKSNKRSSEQPLKQGRIHLANRLPQLKCHCRGETEPKPGASCCGSSRAAGQVVEEAEQEVEASGLKGGDVHGDGEQKLLEGLHPLLNPRQLFEHLAEGLLVVAELLNRLCRVFLVVTEDAACSHGRVEQAVDRQRHRILQLAGLDERAEAQRVQKVLGVALVCCGIVSQQMVEARSSVDAIGLCTGDGIEASFAEVTGGQLERQLLALFVLKGVAGLLERRPSIRPAVRVRGLSNVDQSFATAAQQLIEALCDGEDAHRLINSGCLSKEPGPGVLGASIRNGSTATKSKEQEERAENPGDDREYAHQTDTLHPI